MATDEQAQRDFFVSYTQTDRAWAEWLAWELEAAGYTTVLQAWDMPPGDRACPRDGPGGADLPAHHPGTVARLPALGHGRGGMAGRVRRRSQRRAAPPAAGTGGAVHAKGAAGRPGLDRPCGRRRGDRLRTAA
jgi:hypothetical protein